MSTTKSIHRSVAALNLPTQVPALISSAKAMVQAMTNNASFATPAPPLATVSSAINDLETAETATQSRTKGAATTRNEKKAALMQLLEQVRAYVQTVADTNLENGGSAASQSAGMSVKKTTVRVHTRTFAAQPGAVSGSVKMVALVGRAPRVVRVAVQHRRRQDLDRGAGHVAGQDGHRGADAGRDGHLPLPRRYQDGRGGLEPVDQRHREVAGERAGRAREEDRSAGGPTRAAGYVSR